MSPYLQTLEQRADKARRRYLDAARKAGSLLRKHEAANRLFVCQLIQERISLGLTSEDYARRPSQHR